MSASFTLPSPLPDSKGPGYQQIVNALAAMKETERVEKFKPNFKGQTTPLGELSTRPTLCDIYPQFGDEILAAYLQTTKFTSTVYVNYLWSDQCFTLGSPSMDAGMLIIPTKQDQANLRENMRHFIQINRFRLTLEVTMGSVGPWKPVCYIDFSTDGKKVTTSCDTLVEGHADLFTYIIAICSALETNTLKKHQTGLMLSDLVEIAKAFKRPPP